MVGPDDESAAVQGGILQPYLQQERSGGFPRVSAQPGSGQAPAVIRFTFFDDEGAVPYATASSSMTSGISASTFRNRG